jgi:hypothetical protein
MSHINTQRLRSSLLLLAGALLLTAGCGESEARSADFVASPVPGEARQSLTSTPASPPARARNLAAERELEEQRESSCTNETAAPGELRQETPPEARARMEPGYRISEDAKEYKASLPEVPAVLPAPDAQAMRQQRAYLRVAAELERDFRGSREELAQLKAERKAQLMDEE